jgi:hypothetical protein
MTMDKQIVALAADLFSLLAGSPPLATAAQSAGNAYAAWRTQRDEKAVSILLEEIRLGIRLAADTYPNSFFGLVQRYVNATKQGAARRNLRLLAQTIRHGLEHDCPFEPDKVAANADLVAGLTRDEVKILASFARNRYPSIGKEVQTPHDIFEHVCSELVPNAFESKEVLEANVSALLRTGLIVYPIDWDAKFELTQKFEVLMKLCDLETSLREND